MPIITITEMTLELARRVFEGYESDPFACESKALFRPFVYSEAWLEEHLEKQESLHQCLLAVLLDETPIGEVKLYNISERKGHCEVSVNLKQECYKNQGYGTDALKQAVQYAKRILGIKTMGGRAILKNLRAQRCFKKAGFCEEYRDGGTVYFEKDLTKKEVIKPISVVPLTLDLYRAFEKGSEILLSDEGKKPRYGTWEYDDETVQLHHRMDQLLYRKTFAVLIEGEPIGILKLISRCDDDWTYGIQCTMKSHEYQNRGYGRKAILWALRYAKEELGAKKLYADIDEKNTHAQHVFEKLGFVPIEPHYRGYATRYEIRL